MSQNDRHHVGQFNIMESLMQSLIGNDDIYRAGLPYHNSVRFIYFEIDWLKSG